MSMDLSYRPTGNDVIDGATEIIDVALAEVPKSDLMPTSEATDLLLVARYSLQILLDKIGIE